MITQIKQYDHPDIVKFIGIAAQHQPVMVLMEYVPGLVSTLKIGQFRR